MDDLGFRAADRRRAIHCFDAGKHPNFDFSPFADACRGMTGDRTVLNELALESLSMVAWSDGPPDATCRSELTRLAGLLGVDHRIGDAELKLAYRRLMSRHHPDKLAAASDVEQARRASENSVAIRNAYDLIRASRNVA